MGEFAISGVVRGGLTLARAHPTWVCCSKQRDEARAEYSAFQRPNAMMIVVLLKGVGV